MVNLIIQIYVGWDSVLYTKLMPTIMLPEYDKEFTMTGRFKETAENKPIFDIKAR